MKEGSKEEILLVNDELLSMSIGRSDDSCLGGKRKGEKQSYFFAILNAIRRHLWKGVFLKTKKRGLAFAKGKGKERKEGAGHAYATVQVTVSIVNICHVHP